MGHGQLGHILTYAWLGLVMYLVYTTHGSSARPRLKMTLPYDGWPTPNWTITFNSQESFRKVVDCLCNVSQSTCFFDARTKVELLGRFYLPVTLSGDLANLATWGITIYEKYIPRLILIHYFVLTRHNSAVSDLKCWNKRDRQTLADNPECSSKPQRVYLGGSGFLEIDDKAETFTCDKDDNDDCKDGNSECTRDCLTTTVPTPASSTKRVYNPGNTANNFVDGNTDATMDKQKFSSDPKPAIDGVVAPVLGVGLFILLSVILFRYKKPPNINVSVTCNPGAYAGTLDPPPSYDDVLRGQNASTQRRLHQ